MKKKLLTLAVSATVGATVLAGCGSTDSSEKDSSNGDVETIVIGTGNIYKPFTYVDENGDVAGYDIEVMKAVDELLPEYEFEFEPYEFSNILLSLDSNKIDLAVHEFSYNDERAEKYLYSEESYLFNNSYITVSVDTEGIESFDDLQGKPVYANAGTDYAALLDAYNAEHTDNPIKTEYGSITSDEINTGIKNGKWVATFYPAFDIQSANDAYGEFLKPVGEPIVSSGAYVLSTKDNTELMDAVDGAIKELKDSGKLAELSTEILGADLITETN